VIVAKQNLEALDYSFFNLSLLVKEMEKDTSRETGILLLIKEYKNQFNIPENLDNYSQADYQNAEKRYVKYCLQKGRFLSR
jgi:hypothetical protein